MRIEPELSSVSIVALGTFNPTVFTPAWFVLRGLVPQGVAARADLEVARADGTRFSVDWLHLNVVVDRFVVATDKAPYVRLCDLAVRTFQEPPPHTTLQAFGINRHVHFPVQSPAKRDRLGRALAPVEPWKAVEQDLGFAGKHGRMTSLTMSQLCPQGRPAGGQINVKVEPSVRIADDRGVYVRVNDHYVVDSDGPRSGERFMTLLTDNFETSLRRSDGIVDHIMSLATTSEA